MTSKPKIRQGNVSLILDTYDDLFSDFDPRPTAERGLSVDFIDECKRAIRDKASDISRAELRILVPKNKRNFNEESIIKKRLNEHFAKHFNAKKREIKKERIQGFLLVVVGIALMSVSYLTYSRILFQNEVLRNLFLIITEPAGWFLFWIGGEKIVSNVREIMPDQEFYKKMYKAEILFESY